MPRRIVEDSDEEDSDGEGAPVTKPVAGRRKLSASALGKRPAVPAKPAKGRPKSKQLSDKELGVRGAKEVMELSDDDDFEPDDSEDSEEDESDSEEESSSDSLLSPSCLSFGSRFCRLAFLSAFLVSPMSSLAKRSRSSGEISFH